MSDTPADGLLIVDRQGGILSYNERAATVFGLAWPPANAGQPYADLALPDKVVAALDKACREGQTVTQEWSPPRSKATDPMRDKQAYLLSTEALALPPLGFDGWVLLVRDVSLQRRLESMQRDFVANVSHELRTPLASIRMAAESLQLGAIADQRLKNKFLSNIQREADRLTRLVNELLILASLDQGKTTLRLSAFDPAQLLQDVFTTMEYHANLNDIQLKGEFPEALPIIRADRDRLHQVVINLVDNAIKCNKPHGAVTLRASAEGQRIVIEVCDSGIGIPAIDLPHIFDRFFRVDKSRSRVTGGVGLGLSIVKDIIEAHDGRIGVSSELNVGTTFHIELPLPAGDTKAPAQASTGNAGE